MATISHERPVSPISFEDRIDSGVTSGVPEISRGNGYSNDTFPKHEQSNYGVPKAKHTKTGLSWRTRLIGANRTTTVTESEVLNTGKYRNFYTIASGPQNLSVSYESYTNTTCRLYTISTL